MIAEEDNVIMELRNATYTYPDKTSAVENLSLRIKGGEKIAVIGGNGAGKSTLFLLLNGIYKLTKGEIFLKGEKIKYGRNDLLDLRRSTGIVFQDPETQIFSSSVFEDISFGLENLKYSQSEIKIRVERILKLLNILHIKNKPTHLLSYGEKKKVSIAGILVMNPEILIMDEPDACLDPVAINGLTRLLDGLHKDGKTVIISTQDVNLAYAWANRIIVMKKGEILKDGSPLDIFSDSELIKSASLEVPLVFEIIEKLKILNEFSGGKSIQKNELIDYFKKKLYL